MIVATDFDELVFTCSDLLLHNPNKLVTELIDAITLDSYTAAATTFAIIHASQDLDLHRDVVAGLFSEVSSQCYPNDVLACNACLVDIEAGYYSDYMDEFEGKPVFASPDLLQ